MKKLTNKKRKIITALTAFVVMVMAVILSACASSSAKDFEVFQNTVYSHLVIKEGNRTTENFRLNYSGATWQTEEAKEEFLLEVGAFFEDFSDMLDTHYKTLLSEKEISEENMPQKYTTISHENNNIIIVASFPSSEIWREVSLKDGFYTSTRTETNLLSYTIFETVEKLGSVINIGGVDRFVGDFFFEELFEFLESENFDNVSNSSQIKKVFAYATEKRRLKSDAESVRVLEGKYFHFWNLTEDQDITITFSSTYARVEVWYTLAIAIALFSLSIIFFISYLKKEKEVEPKPILLSPYAQKTENKEKAENQEKAENKEKIESDKSLKSENKEKEQNNQLPKKPVQEKVLKEKGNQLPKKPATSKPKTTSSKTADIETEKTQADLEKPRRKTTKKED